MKIKLSDREKKILKVLRVKDAGKNEKLFDNLEIGEINFDEIGVLCCIINAEFMMEGILPNFEPNEYGIELERLLDFINSPRLKF